MRELCQMILVEAGGPTSFLPGDDLGDPAESRSLRPPHSLEYVLGLIGEGQINRTSETR